MAEFDLEPVEGFGIPRAPEGMGIPRGAGRRDPGRGMPAKDKNDCNPSPIAKFKSKNSRRFTQVQILNNLFVLLPVPAGRANREPVADGGLRPEPAAGRPAAGPGPA